MAEQAKRNFVVNFCRGFFAPFRSVRILRRNPRLIQYILIPFLINILVFSGAVYLGLDFFGSTVVDYIPQGDAWYWSILSGLLWVVAVLLTAILVFFSFTVIGNLLLKTGVQHPGVVAVWPLSLLNGRTLLGALSFCCAMVFYMMVLKRTTLKLAQSIFALQFVLVIIAANVILGEPIGIQRWLGIGLIAAGLFVVSLTVPTNLQ